MAEKKPQERKLGMNDATEGKGAKAGKQKLSSRGRICADGMKWQLKG